MVKTWILLLSALLTTSVATAESNKVVAEVFPLGVLNIWWGESIASAKTKCPEFQVSRDRSKAYCGDTESSVTLDFTKNKLSGFSWDISISEYTQCISDILRSISDPFPSPRWESHGYEFWSMGYADHKGRVIGKVSCWRRFEGCDTNPSSCTPTVAYTKY
jgi:hypothetical protein